MLLVTTRPGLLQRLATGLATAGLLTACGLSAGTTRGSSGPVVPADQPLTISQTLDADAPRGLLTVHGALVAVEGQQPRLCEALAESFPPQCGGATLTIKGLDVSSLGGAQTAQDTTWVELLTLQGSVTSGVLTVTDVVE